MNFSSKVISIIYILFIIFTILHFIIPFVHDEGSIPNLKFSYDNNKSIDLGYEKPINALFFDYVYVAGHYTCHQRSDRSYFLNDNQMPVCSRCIGIYLGISLVFFIAIWRQPSGSFFRSLCELIRSDRYSKSIVCDTIIIILLGSILSIPMLADGFLQIFTLYVSNDSTRIITGSLFGLFEGGFIIGLLSHIVNKFYL